MNRIFKSFIGEPSFPKNIELSTTQRMVYLFCFKKWYVKYLPMNSKQVITKYYFNNSTSLAYDKTTI